MTKTPYELRFDILQLARTHLMEKFHADFETFRTEAEQQRIDMAYPKYRDFIDKNKPAYPELSQIMKLAEELKTFVDKG